MLFKVVLVKEIEVLKKMLSVQSAKIRMIICIMIAAAIRAFLG